MVCGYQRDKIPFPFSPFFNTPAPSARIPPCAVRFLKTVWNARSHCDFGDLANSALGRFRRQIKIHYSFCQPLRVARKNCLPDSGNLFVEFNHDDRIGKMLKCGGEADDSTASKRLDKKLLADSADSSSSGEKVARAKFCRPDNGMDCAAARKKHSPARHAQQSLAAKMFVIRSFAKGFSTVRFVGGVSNFSSTFSCKWLIKSSILPGRDFVI